MTAIHQRALIDAGRATPFTALDRFGHLADQLQCGFTAEHFAGIHIAVPSPCFNEGAPFTKVVGDVRAALPHAAICVYESNTTDDTIAQAEAAGAIVRRDAPQGKARVIRPMFADIDADAYALVDGDATYTADAAPDTLALLIGRRPAW
jgi:hypothetical protein